MLTGGASRRMGRDKALLRVRGRSLAAVAADALADAGAIEVLLIGGDGAALADAAPGARPVADQHPGEGPLGGILTAFDAVAATDAPADLVAVVACDMPRLDAGTIGALVEAATADPTLAVAAALVEGRPQPLTAVWRPSQAGAVLRAAFAAGERAPRRLLPKLALVGVEGLDDAVGDVDSPQDLARYADDLGHDPSRGSSGRDLLFPDEAL
ncbi:molybdenum cofactor guanylyltransferase [Rhabdothermincola salaria]|uniref:molybdenum cofactor guanylyltransferase n=1 Tax=Rhabdothermincola salaria TaxID=2903142 RepID=UPI003211C5AD